MTIPNVETLTTQLDQNTDQLPGNDVNDSAREQILDAVQKLNSIISQYGGAEMITSANLDAQNVAKTDADNDFTVSQTVKRNGPALQLDTTGTTSPQMNLRENGAARGQIAYNVSSNVFTFDNVVAGGGVLALADSGLMQLISAGAQLQMNTSGDILLIPKSGRKNYKTSASAINELLSGASVSAFHAGTSMASGASVEFTEALTGVSGGNPAIASPAVDIGSAFTWEAWCSTNVAHIRIHNVSNGTATPATSTWNIRAFG